MTLGIAIPSYSGHTMYLTELLDAISKSTVLPNQVSISISSVTDPIVLKNYDFEVILTSTSEFNNSSKNRNIAASKLTTDIVSFIDGDDFPHIKRNEYLLKAFDDGCQSVVHAFSRGRNRSVNLDWDIGDLNYHLNYLQVCSDERAGPQPKNGFVLYANGHVSICKWIFDELKYNEDPSLHRCCEDSEFNARIVGSGYELSFINNELTYYFN